MSAIDEVLDAAIATGAVPNVVAMAADDSGQIYEHAAGPRAVGQPDPVSADTLFRIASMTKIVTTTAALQLTESGELDLDAPVSAYRPEFAQLQVLDGFDGDGTPKLRAPRTQATVRHLMTHTSGLAYYFFNADILRWEKATGTPNVLAGDDASFTAPLVADPGTRVEYGISTDWLGRVIETVSGRSLKHHLDEHILGPLAMHDTTFQPTKEQRASSVPVHLHDRDRDDNAWVATTVDWPQQPDWWSGGHGLYSTPRDFLRFQRMLLGRGTLEGTQILEPQTVDELFKNATGALDFPQHIKTAHPASSADLDVGPGHKWSLGLLLNTEQQPGMRAPGSGGWAGIDNTYFWVDPTANLTAALYTQTLPFVEPAVRRVFTDFETALYQR